MAWWHENVFLRLLIAFAVGILLAEVIPFAWWPLFFLPVLLLASVTFFQRRSITALLRLRRWREVLVHASLASGGVLASLWLNPSHHPLHYTNAPNATHYVARPTEPPEEKTKVVRVKAELVKAIDADGTRRTFGTAYVYLRKSERALALEYGDMLLLRNTLQPVEPDPNPHAIDYRFILRNKLIFKTGFLNDAQWSRLPEAQPHAFYAFALRMRDNILRTLQRNVRADVLPLAASLLLGYRDAMDFDLENAYAAAGVIHIMAVSGMHVGLIFMLLNGILGMRLFGFIPEVVRKVLLLGCIWFFATITGFTGSVVRATMMLSIYIFGVNLKRYVSPHNILFASAFVLLAARPRLLFDVGFELSFLAVAGILTFQKPIYNLVNVHNPVLDWLVKMMSISAAAQLGTLPLILYYFHQFPTHFLLANLLVVPLATLLIYGMLFL
ncbi:MAG TPA: ComEC/Rec2 family competence protein, partial [Chitinophagales bacterium]|nr:ComEC/Rec2 family competence protein [Chitinophagales bacterium]